MTTKIESESVSAGRWHLGRRARDILSGAVVTLFAVVIYLQTGGLPKGAASFPRGIAIVLGLSGVLLMLRSLRLARTGKAEVSGYSWKLFAIAVPLWCATVWLIRPLDFFIVAPVFMAILSWVMLGVPRTAVGVLRAVAFGIVMSAGIWAVFVQVLGVSLP